MKFTEKFKIKENVDFVDINLDGDLEMFVDPYLIYLCDNEFGISCSNKIVNYFSQLLNYAKIGDRGNGYRIVRYLQENNEVRLGYSKGKPCGKGLGKNKGKELFDIISKSKAVKTGLVEDIFDASIMLEKVGYDKISDLTINIILEDLIIYTQHQCNLYNIQMQEVSLKRPIWSNKNNKWINSKRILLPTHNSKPIVLIPKIFTQQSLIYSYIRFYSHRMIPFYEKQVQQDPSSGLVKILKRGPVPSRTKIRKEYPCIKSDVINFIYEKPEEYKDFKKKQLNYVSIDNL